MKNLENLTVEPCPLIEQGFSHEEHQWRVGDDEAKWCEGTDPE